MWYYLTHNWGRIRGGVEFVSKDINPDVTTIVRQQFQLTNNDVVVQRVDYYATRIAPLILHPKMKHK